jgi:hypothetical protein
LNHPFEALKFSEPCQFLFAQCAYGLLRSILTPTSVTGSASLLMACSRVMT